MEGNHAVPYRGDDRRPFSILRTDAASHGKLQMGQSLLVSLRCLVARGWAASKWNGRVSERSQTSGSIGDV